MREIGEVGEESEEVDLGKKEMGVVSEVLVCFGGRCARELVILRGALDYFVRGNLCFSDGFAGIGWGFGDV